MERHHNINYLEIPSANLSATKAFFSTVFGWTFVDYGSEYCSFSAQGIDGGFYQTNTVMRSENGSALIVLYSSNLEQTLAVVEANGGEIMKATFEFPGGRRFHFCAPGGGEFAVWSE